jgi:hypothetical protein
MCVCVCVCVCMCVRVCVRVRASIHVHVHVHVRVHVRVSMHVREGACVYLCARMHEQHQLVCVMRESALIHVLTCQFTTPLFELIP